jgi:2-dehydropantoate 2-reductase
VSAIRIQTVCIVGAGAIGGFVGAKLAAAGQVKLSALARGATLQALREHGFRMNSAQGLVQGPVQASDSAAALGAQDLVVIAVKGPALPEVAQSIAPLLAPHTIVMPAMNGVPWWFCQGLPGLGDVPLQSVDPGGVVSRSIPLAHVLGCVVHASTSTPAPGVVQHKMGRGLIIGEPQGGRSARAQAVVDLMAQAGFDATHSDRVRYDIWYKLWGNMTMNPITAITGATVDKVLADPLLRNFCTQAMAEAAALGVKLGCEITQSPEDRHLITAKLGAFKTSMLQDVEAGRALELDALVTVVHEIARRLGHPTPNVDVLLGLSRIFGRMKGLYPAG